MHHARRLREDFREWRVGCVLDVGGQFLRDLLAIRAQEHAAHVEDAARLDRRLEVRPAVPHGRAETEHDGRRPLHEERRQRLGRLPSGRVIEQDEPRVPERRPAVGDRAEPVGKETDHALGRRRPPRQDASGGRKPEGGAKLVDGRSHQGIGDPLLRAPVRGADQRPGQPRHVDAVRGHGRIIHAAGGHRLKVRAGVGDTKCLVGDPRREGERGPNRDRLAAHVRARGSH